jgi:hypothetical protein
MKDRTSTSSKAFGFLAVLVVLLLSLPSPAMADHRPKHVREAEEPVVTEDLALVEAITEVVDQLTAPAEDSAASEKDTRKEGADQAVLDSTADQTEKLKVDKGAKDKPKAEAAGIAEVGAADPPKNTCTEGGCEKSNQKDQQTSLELNSETAGTAEVVLPGLSASAGPDAGEAGRSGGARHLLTTGDRGSSARGEGPLVVDGAAAVLTGAQPSLAIVVNALNDADGDGIYSDSETASVAGADISFKAIITNMGSTAFEIAAVNHSFIQNGGRIQIDVCADLDGLTLGFGESLACSFSVEDYSPPLGKSVVNTVTASAIEVTGSGRRGTSDSDNTSVATLLGDQVLAVAIERAADPLAFTGTDAARLVIIGFMLLAVGGALLRVSRTRTAVSARPVFRVGPAVPVPPPGLEEAREPTLTGK